MQILAGSRISGFLNDCAFDSHLSGIAAALFETPREANDSSTAYWGFLRKGLVCLMKQVDLGTAGASVRCSFAPQGVFHPDIE